jgi:hypothetical protein
MCTHQYSDLEKGKVHSGKPPSEDRIKKAKSAAKFYHDSVKPLLAKGKLPAQRGEVSVPSHYPNDLATSAQGSGVPICNCL